jgi:hypothetical protein
MASFKKFRACVCSNLVKKRSGRPVVVMERRLVATTVRNIDHAHERQSTGRSWHGRFTQGPEAQLARAYSPAVHSLLRS